MKQDVQNCKQVCRGSVWAETALHYNMSFVGGFLGVYAMFLRGGNFGSAQTANLIYLITGWLQGRWEENVIRLFSLLIYVGFMVAAFLLPHYLKTDKRRFCIWLEAACVLLCGFLPGEMNPLIALYPIFAATAFQWGVFGGAKGHSSATIFSTNNLKQMVLSWTEYFRTGEKKQREAAGFYTATLVYFHLGVLSGFAALHQWEIASIWACLVPLGTALALVEIDCALAQREDTAERTGEKKKNLARMMTAAGIMRRMKRWAGIS